MSKLNKRGLSLIAVIALFSAILVIFLNNLLYNPPLQNDVISLESTLFQNIDTSEIYLAKEKFHNLNHEDFLYDFNYLISVLEDNWPFFNISLSANGVDVMGLADNIIYILSNHDYNINGAIEFANLLDKYFLSPIGGLGHLHPSWSYDVFSNTLEHARAIVYNPETQLIARYTDIDLTDSHYGAISRIESIIFHEARRNYIDNTPIEFSPLPIVETSIIEDGRIAYLQIRHMIPLMSDPFLQPSWLSGTPQMGHYEGVIYNFYRYIQDFEHLIIDLRHNPGGSTQHFDMFVIAPILNEAITLPSYVFFTDGDYSTRARNDPVHQQSSRNLLQEIYLLDPLPYLDNSLDFAYVFRSSYSVSPAGLFVGQFASIRQEIVFEGDVWLLVDEHTASAAEAATAILKYNQIATVVGTATEGVFGVNSDHVSAKISLPNSGIVLRIDTGYYTDLHGRAFEGYGVSPNYLNHYGLDALETTLALINEKEN